MDTDKTGDFNCNQTKLVIIKLDTDKTSDFNWNQTKLVIINWIQIKLVILVGIRRN